MYRFSTLTRPFATPSPSLGTTRSPLVIVPLLNIIRSSPINCCFSLAMQTLLVELHQIWTQLYELTVADSNTLTKAKKTTRSKSPKLDVFPVINLDTPTPDSLIFELVRIGTPRTIAQELVEIHTRLVSELAAHHKRHE